MFVQKLLGRLICVVLALCGRIVWHAQSVPVNSYIDALLVDEEQADLIWVLWARQLIDIEIAVKS